MSKLVRDRIPEIIQAAGRACEIEMMNEVEYQKALRQKLIEEAHEAAIAIGDDLIKELADLYEVIDGLMTINHIDPEEVVKTQEQRRVERGEFNKRLLVMKGVPTQKDK